MRGEISSGRHSKRHPLDWYVDEVWCANQLAAALDYFAREKAEGLAVWDPCCGYGHTVDAAYGEGLQVHLSDVVDNVAWSAFDLGIAGPKPTFFHADLRTLTAAPQPCSIVFNPPYSYEKGILEQCVRKALALSSLRVCTLVPNKWLSSQVRYQLFAKDHPPQAILHLTQRPSMPPGDMISAMGNRAFRGGMIDYCWIVWDVTRPTAPGETRTIWLPKLSEPIAPIKGIA